MLTPWLSIAIAVLCSSWFSLSLPFQQGEDQPNLKLDEQRKLLGSVKAGMTAKQVMDLLGQPDEIRRTPANEFSLGRAIQETERWVYGIMGEGLFARVGYVCLNADGKVLAAVPADCFMNPKWPNRPKQLEPRSDQALETATKMRCHLHPVNYERPKGYSAEGFHTKVTVINDGDRQFVIKHEAASLLDRLMIVEVRDAKGVLLFREDRSRYIGSFDLPPEQWKTFSIAAHAQKSTDLYVWSASGFGRFPPGTYSFRVYFLMEDGKYYPSNLVKFEVKKEHQEQPNPR